MRLKKLGGALAVAAALAVILASNALAAATTTDVKWYTGASPGTELMGSETASAELVGTGITYTTVFDGQKVVFEAKKFSLSNYTIENSGGTAVGHTHMTFEDVSVEEPPGCSISEKIATNELTMTADWMIGTANYIKFVPTAGEEKGFFTLSLSGSECPLAGTFVTKGSLFVQTVNSTGTQAVSQQANSSKAINETAGGKLHVGTEAAWLEGSFAMKLSGTKAGQAFGTH